MIGIRTSLREFQNNKAWLPLTALATLLIGIGITVGYFISSANLSDEANKIQAVSPVIKPDADFTLPPRVLVLPSPEILDSSESDDVEKTKNKSLTSMDGERDKPSERQAQINEKTTNSKSSPLQDEIKRPVIVVNQPRRKESSGTMRPRVVVSESVPDIESIFTGRSSNERNERIRYEPRSGRGGNISKEEWREIRRQRKQERRKRGNERFFPF